jgi:hypothetical protein
MAPSTTSERRGGQTADKTCYDDGLAQTAHTQTAQRLLAIQLRHAED